MNFDDELKRSKYNIKILNKKFSLIYNTFWKTFRKSLNLKNKDIIRYSFIKNVIDNDIYTLQNQINYQNFLNIMRENDHRVKFIIEKF